MFTEYSLGQLPQRQILELSAPQAAIVGVFGYRLVAGPLEDKQVLGRSARPAFSHVVVVLGMIRQYLDIKCDFIVVSSS